MSLFKKTPDPKPKSTTWPVRDVTLTGECPDPSCGRQIEVTMATLAPVGAPQSTHGSCPDCGLPVVAVTQ